MMSDALRRHEPEPLPVSHAAMKTSIFVGSRQQPIQKWLHIKDVLDDVQHYAAIAFVELLVPPPIK